MDAASFAFLLEQLDDADWQRVLDGQGVLLVDDLRLAIGSPRAPNVIVAAPPAGGVDAPGLKRRSLAGAAAILGDYYRTHPLTLAGFNRQLEHLIATYGAGAFAALPGQQPERTLVVDDGRMVAETADSPRHRDGFFCLLEGPGTEAELEARVRRWIERDEAYERYLGMHACRCSG